MKVAIAHWQGRISPVFDVSDRVLLVHREGETEIGREDVRLTSRDPYRRAREISLLGTDVLLCGAVSQTLERALTGAGVKVVGFVRGEMEEVLRAFARRQLKDGREVRIGVGRDRRRSRVRGCRNRDQRINSAAQTGKGS